MTTYPSGRWCHIVTDGDVEELRAFAQRPGLRWSWFQDHRRLPHYDLGASKRARALALGAETVSAKELFRRGRETILRPGAGCERPQDRM